MPIFVFSLAYNVTRFFELRTKPVYGPANATVDAGNNGSFAVGDAYNASAVIVRYTVEPTAMRKNKR